MHSRSLLLEFWPFFPPTFLILIIIWLLQDFEEILQDFEEILQDSIFPPTFLILIII